MKIGDMTLKFKLTITALIILIILTILLRPYYLFVTKTLHVSPLKTLFSIDGPKSYNDHVNVLFLGIAGED
ncbi:MAG: hypothetical protein Q7J11_01290, partial [Candidatus Roizmanbacteria bacterium]|nr:hypothetical protein [Candidatus Roizmanbacteria bacterium]